jgi:hypothetical protein
MTPGTWCGRSSRAPNARRFLHFAFVTSGGFHLPVSALDFGGPRRSTIRDWGLSCRFRELCRPGRRRGEGVYAIGSIPTSIHQTIRQPRIWIYFALRALEGIAFGIGGFGPRI